MNKYVTLKTVVSAVLLSLIPAFAQAWTYTINCEDGAVGSTPANTDLAFWGKNTIITNEQASEGSKSCKFSIKKGSEGWPSSGGPLEWGAVLSLPSNVKVGEELWVRFDMFVPTGFDIWTNTGMLKFIRFGTKTSTRTTGCVDFLMGVPNAKLWDPIAKKDVSPPFVVSFEGVPQLSMVGTRPTNDVVTGVWETYEAHVKVDSIPQSLGGQSTARMWKNNVPIADLPGQITAVDKTGVVQSIYLFTYWNGNAPKDQHVYIDNITVTNQQPANVDRRGHAYIGGDTYYQEGRQISKIQLRVNK